MGSIIEGAESCGFFNQSLNLTRAVGDGGGGKVEIK